MAADTFPHVAYTKISPSIYENRFLKILKPAVCVIHLFGKSYLYSSLYLKILSKILFLLIFSFMAIIFVFAVFGRNAIDTWTQLSLYIIPALAIPCGARIFASDFYNEVLLRDVTTTTMVRFFISPRPDIESSKPSAHNKDWLKFIAIKSLVYPFSLEFIQWAGFLSFAFSCEDSERSMIGEVELSDAITYHIWKSLYIAFWSLAIYLVGFLLYQFVFISRLIVRDTVSLMSLFGKSPFLKSKPIYDLPRKPNLCFKVLICFINFLSFDLLSSFQDEKTFSKSAQLIRQCDHNDIEKCKHIKSDTQNGNRALSPALCNEKDIVGDMSAFEATDVFSKFIAEVEGLTSIFTPFTVVLSFFGVANLITHVGLFVYKPKPHAHLDYWTLYRTIIFLFVALRMLLSVRHVSLILGRLPPHLKFLQSSGKLMKNRAEHEDWKLFFELMDSFNLGRRSFGFPLTLRQVASIATFLNMGLLIVLSICKSANGS